MARNATRLCENTGEREQMTGGGIRDPHLVNPLTKSAAAGRYIGCDQVVVVFRRLLTLRKFAARGKNIKRREGKLKHPFGQQRVEGRKTSMTVRCGRKNCDEQKEPKMAMNGVRSLMKGRLHSRGHASQKS